MIRKIKMYYYAYVIRKLNNVYTFYLPDNNSINLVYL